MWTPLMAREMTRRWISLVPSKIVAVSLDRNCAAVTEHLTRNAKSGNTERSATPFAATFASFRVRFARLQRRERCIKCARWDSVRRGQNRWSAGLVGSSACSRVRDPRLRSAEPGPGPGVGIGRAAMLASSSRFVLARNITGQTIFVDPGQLQNWPTAGGDVVRWAHWSVVTPRSETRYAKTPSGAHVAFQVVGDGDLDLVIAANIHPVDLVGEDPRLSAAVERLASTIRVIMFDRRGFGASDGFAASRMPTLEEFVEDVVSVMDAAGSARAAFLKTDHAGVALLCATTHPDRVSGLLVVNSYARLAWARDYRMGIPAKVRASYVDDIDAWSPDLGIDVLAEPRAKDPGFRDWFSRCLRAAGGPARSAAILQQEFDTDARDLLPLVQVPALVVHSVDNPYISLAHGQYLAAHIPGARLVELAGSGHALAATELDALVDEVTEFVTGVRPRGRTGRVFAAVLFTDIVNSTPLAARLGDREWRTLLDQHDAMLRRQLERFGGRLVKTTGDGAVVTFDGPARAIDCAAAIRDGLSRLGLVVRIGVHAGEVEQRGDDVTGIAVHVASRVQAFARPGEIVVSRTVVDLVAGSGLDFDDRGDHTLKGVPGVWRLFAVHSA
jgi:class 3 adenylate cyclase